MRRKVIAGNWKMNMLPNEAIAYIQEFAPLVEKSEADNKEMRCPHCNVDLAETYEKCPLCGEAAVHEQVRLKGLKAAPYPKNSPVKPAEKSEKPKTGFSLEKIKAYFNT